MRKSGLGKIFSTFGASIGFDGLKIGWPPGPVCYYITGKEGTGRSSNLGRSMVFFSAAIPLRIETGSGLVKD